jgi:hypothetical protein
LLVDPTGKSKNDWLTGSLCLSVPVLILCWFISIPIIQATQIPPSHATRRHLTLERVSPAFVQAVEEYRTGRPPEVLPAESEGQIQTRRSQHPWGLKE